MSIAFDKVAAEGLSSDSSTTLSVTVASGGVAVGNLCVMIAYMDVGGSSFTGAIDARGNTWTMREALANAGGGAPFSTAVFYSILTTALQAADLITVSRSVGAFADWGAAAVSYSGIAAASPLDQYTSGQDAAFPTTTQFDSGGVTTTQANEVFVGLHAGLGTGNTFSPTGGWTPRKTKNITGAGNQGTIYIEDLIVSSITSDGSSPLANAACYWNAHAMTFEEESAAPQTMLVMGMLGTGRV
jgi:hypothetical protein